jgi:hypothetical protein
MNINVRIERKDILKEIVETPVDVVSIGNEFCSYRFPSIDDLMSMIDMCNAAQKKWKIVTPYFPRTSEFNRILDIIKQIIDKYENVDIVANDFGFLDKINELIKKGKSIQVTIGQMLSYSWEEYPFSCAALQKEIDFYKKTWRLNVFLQSDVIEYFSNMYNFNSIELNYLPLSLQSMDYFLDKNIDVEFVEKYFPVSATRNCHVARYNKKKPFQKNCAVLCRDKVYVGKLKQRIDLDAMGRGYKELPDNVKAEFPTLYVFGNSICNKYNEPLDVEKLSRGTVLMKYTYYGNIPVFKERIEYYKKGDHQAL